MEEIKIQLEKSGFNLDNKKGYYVNEFFLSEFTLDANQTWSKLAKKKSPIYAAAASNSKDPFVKGIPNIIKENLPKKNDLILDAGCGYGRLAIPIAKYNNDFRIVAVDASNVMLKYFASLVEENQNEINKENIFLVNCGIDSLPFSSNTFDYIYSSAVLLHNPYSNIDRIISEWKRILKPSGIIILSNSFPSLYNFNGIISYLYLKFGKKKLKSLNGPVRPFTRKMVSTLFSDWENVDIFPSGTLFIPKGIGRLKLPFNKRLKLINNLLSKLKNKYFIDSEIFSRELNVIARK